MHDRPFLNIFGQALRLDEGELKKKKIDLGTHEKTMDFMIENADKSAARFRSIIGPS